MPESRSPGSDGYTDLHAKWVKEGSPFQFDEIGSYGGRLWKIHDRDNDDGPTFLLIAAAGPTDSGYDVDTEEYKSADWEPSSGYEVEMQDNGLRFLRGDAENDFKIAFKSLPRDVTV